MIQKTIDNLTEKKKTTDSTESKRIKKKVIETLSGYKYKLIYYYYIQYILCLYIKNEQMNKINRLRKKYHLMMI